MILQGEIVYEVVPPGSEYFTLNRTNGMITLAKSVKDDLSTDYRVSCVHSQKCPSRESFVLKHDYHMNGV